MECLDDTLVLLDLVIKMNEEFFISPLTKLINNIKKKELRGLNVNVRYKSRSSSRSNRCFI